MDRWKLFQHGDVYDHFSDITAGYFSWLWTSWHPRAFLNSSWWSLVKLPVAAYTQASLLSTKVVSVRLKLGHIRHMFRDLHSHNVTISLSVSQVEMNGLIRPRMNLAHCGEPIHHLSLAVPEDPSGCVSESVPQCRTCGDIEQEESLACEWLP